MSALRNAAAIGSVLSLLLAPDLAEAQRRSRAQFFADTPFGSLAWVSGATTKASARGKRAVFDLSGERCTQLPATGRQWFLINHRDEEQVGRTGYFSVRILYSFEPGDAASGPDEGVHLYRNSNWYDSSNTEITDEYEKGYFQVPLTRQTFIELHSPAKGMEDGNLHKLEDAVGQWHMKPTDKQESSWADHPLYGAMLRAYSSATTGAISARLIRFTPTAGVDSRDPVLFWLDPRGASFATILVDAPRNPGSNVQRNYTVRFDDHCP